MNEQKERTVNDLTDDEKLVMEHFDYNIDSFNNPKLKGEINHYVTLVEQARGDGIEQERKRMEGLREAVKDESLNDGAFRMVANYILNPEPVKEVDMEWARGILSKYQESQGGM